MNLSSRWDCLGDLGAVLLMKFKTGEADGLYIHLANNDKSKKNILDPGKFVGKGSKSL
jgi:hypothetical protein